MKKVIALFSLPSEGDASLRFINCNDGQVILDINLTMEEDPWSVLKRRNILSEIGVFYDSCAKQRYAIGDVKDFIPYSISAFADPKCTIPLDDSLEGFWEKMCRENLTILTCSKQGRINRNKFGVFDPDMKIYSWKYTVAKTESETEYIYHPQKDSVYMEIFEKTGLRLSAKDRSHMSHHTLASKIADAMDYELLNTLFG